MKRSIFSVFAALALAANTFAYEFPGFEWEVGADITSAYLWRGLNYGGLAFQPDASIGYGGLKAEAWFNLSPMDYTFSEFAPEMDITLSYSIAGLTVGATHMFYFDGTKFFDYSRPSTADFLEENYAGNQTEVFASYSFGEIWENVPLTIFWSTHVGGSDWYLDDNNNVKKAYSSYLEFSYNAELPLGFTLTPTVGLTPYKSMYTFYEGKFAFNNLSLKLNWEYEVSDHFCLDVYAVGMLNTYGLNKENVWAATDNTYSLDNSSRHLNGAIGLGLWFY